MQARVTGSRPVQALMLAVLLIAGCRASEPPPPPVAPMPEDLSTWTLPTLIQEEPQPPHLDTPRPPPPPPTPAEKVYKYAHGQVYTVPVAVGFPLRISFPPGEQVRDVTDGDLVPQADGQHRRWQYKQAREGTGAQEHGHVIVTVSEPGLKNGLLITTVHRVYDITLESVRDTKIRVLRWTYAPESTPVGQSASAPAGPLPPLDGPTRYHVGYTLASSRPAAPAWMPRQIVDDGKKTYILFAEVTLFDTVPLLRLIGPNGPQVVNARQYLNVVIVDQLIARAELRVGTGETAEVVTITRGQLRSIQCPGAGDDCPRWPDAARQLQRKTS